MTTPMPDPFDVSTWPTPPRRPDKVSRPRRRYTLTPEGLAALRASVVKTRPWTKSTGPRTPEGKARTRYNRLKDGTRSAEAVQRRKVRTAAFRHVHKVLAAWEDGNVVLSMLSRLATLLSIPFDELAALCERDSAAEWDAVLADAARRRGVSWAALQRWIQRADRCRTVDALDRLKLPTPKPPPIRIELADPSEW